MTTVFVGIAPGLEHALAEEIQSLAQRPVQVVEGGVEIEGDVVDAAGLALWSHCAGQVLVRIAELPAASLEQLRQGVMKVDWSQWIHPGQTVEVRVTKIEARLGRTDVITKKVERAIGDKMRSARRRGRPPRDVVQIRVRVRGKRATLSIDAGGPSLHKRGWRQATAKAPIRENLAAACLMAAGWQPGVPLFDPMCGAGTFPIEAACWNDDRAPGVERIPPITRVPCFPAKTWQQMLAEARTGGRDGGVVVGSDRNQGAIDAARANAKRAGVAPTLERKSATAPLSTPVQGPGLVILNPPYGKRVAENIELAPLYRKTGQALRLQFPGWRVACVCPEASLAGHLGRKMEQVARFSNGGISVSLFVGELPAAGQARSG
ncbi:MAG: hypothetical protein GY913_09995 [Proteobacteria bacterium]|nr:hypothetical protein [Pseudomonadota bacterium]MCP4917244.1 hypothetical protein [Pseudomonadota bacterium]